MLVHDYFYYFWRISGAALFTLWGIIAVIIFAGALYLLFTAKRGLGSVAAIIAIVCFTVGIYAAKYEIPESIEAQRQVMDDSEWQSCGTGFAKPTPSGYGMSNPCEWGCFRGATIRNIMTMGEFPPWPRFQREVQCWRRTGPWAIPVEPAAQAAQSNSSDSSDSSAAH